MTRLGFRAAAVASEALGNLNALRLHAVAVMTICAAASALAAWGTASEVALISASQAELLSRGLDVRVVAGKDGARLDARQCESLNDVDGVLAAGGLVGYSQAMQFGGGNTNLTIATVTRGYASVIWPSLQRVKKLPSAIAGSDLSSAAGLVNGSYMSLRDASAPGPAPVHVDHVDRVAPNSQRNPRFDDYLAVVAAPVDDVQECLVEAAPGAESGVDVLLATWFRGTETTSRPLYVVTDAAGDPENRLANRSSWSFSLISAVGITLTMMGSWIVRRADFALYRHLGLRPHQLVLSLSVDATILALMPASMGLTLVALTERPELTGATLAAVSLCGAQLLSLIVLLPMIGTAMLMTRNPLSVFGDVS